MFPLHGTTRLNSLFLVFHCQNLRFHQTIQFTLVCHIWESLWLYFRWQMLWIVSRDPLHAVLFFCYLSIWFQESRVNTKRWSLIISDPWLIRENRRNQSHHIICALFWYFPTLLFFQQSFVFLPFSLFSNKACFLVINNHIPQRRNTKHLMSASIVSLLL